MSVKKDFKAESKRLLDLMINSIYTHKEIFLRELISNASDALDKMYFKSLTDTSAGLNKSDFIIRIDGDTTAHTLKITDNGIGMTEAELENNLGVIAKSGSLAFKEENGADDVDIIGQFGVGFYSSFMVAKKVTVKSKAYGAEKAYLWISEGVDGYTIEECEKDSFGTEITLTLKDDTADEKYSDFAETWKIRSLVKKYSDYIRYPIQTETTHKHLVEGTGVDGVDPEYTEHTELETLNSMVPIWRKNKNELTPEDYNEYYKEKFFDWEDPLLYIHKKTEGIVTYDSLLYIPKKPPMDYYSKDFEKGLQLYCSGVMITEKCKELLPDHFSFVRGLVDSADLSLNISREVLQQDRQLRAIAKSIEKSIKSELKKLLENDRPKYEEFWKAFGVQIKFGIYNGYGVNKAELQDLLMFWSSSEKKYVTLDEYVSRMQADQKYIYYAAADSVSRADSLPQTEILKEKGIEILYLTENVDEFAIQILQSYSDKPFKNVSSDDTEIGGENNVKTEEAKKATEDNKDLFEAIAAALEGKIKSAKASDKLRTHAACISNEGQISLEMEKTFAKMPEAQGTPKAEKVLEINPDHPIFGKLKSLYQTDKDKLSDYAKILYSQALLVEGMPLENPLEYSELITKLMV
ncbi:MAG: molecular chaperone HtpG [Ruminococcus sp.]|jgi:molecular chaperone HtpG|nr:molecular chaperone HtpG [Ruminococcus sp.]